MTYKKEIFWIVVFTMLFWLSVFTVNAYASIPKNTAKPHCKPVIYDALYLRLVKESLVMNIEKLGQLNREGVFVDETMKHPQLDVFQLFREMCYGQKSSYEKWAGP